MTGYEKVPSATWFGNHIVVKWKVTGLSHSMVLAQKVEWLHADFWPPTAISARCPLSHNEVWSKRMKETAAAMSGKTT